MDCQGGLCLAFRILAAIGNCAKKTRKCHCFRFLASLSVYHSWSTPNLTNVGFSEAQKAYIVFLITGRSWILCYFILLLNFRLKSYLSCRVKEISVNWVIVRLATFMTSSDSWRTVYIRISFRAKAYFLRFLPRWFVVPFLKAPPTVPMVALAGKRRRHDQALQENGCITNLFLINNHCCIGDYWWPHSWI